MVQMDARRLHQSPLTQGFDEHLTEVSCTSFVEKIATMTPVDDVPEMAIRSEEASYLSESSELIVAAKNNLVGPRLDECNSDSPQMRSPLGKAPSNVRNMISAFESSLPQVKNIFCFQRILYIITYEAILGQKLRYEAWLETGYETLCEITTT